MDRPCFHAFDSEALQVDLSSPRLMPGRSIARNCATPDGTIYRFDDAFTGATVTLNDSGGSDIAFHDDEGRLQIVRNGGPQVVDGYTVQADCLQHFQQIDEEGRHVGPVLTLALFCGTGAHDRVWGFNADHALCHGARYIKVGGNDVGSTRIDSLALGPDRQTDTVVHSDETRPDTFASPRTGRTRYAYLTLDQSDLMRRVQQANYG